MRHHLRNGLHHGAVHFRIHGVASTGDSRGVCEVVLQRGVGFQLLPELLQQHRLAQVTLRILQMGHEPAAVEAWRLTACVRDVGVGGQAGLLVCGSSL